MYEDDRARSRRERSHRIAEMLTGGMTHRQIGVELGISGPAVTQWIARDSELRRLRTATTITERRKLRAFQSELTQTYRQVRSLAQAIRRALKAIDEEIEASEIDELLGLR